MSRLRYLTAGESHGPALVGILEGIPAGLPLLAEEIDRELARRQLGYGRGGRMKIEQDRVEILAGVRFGQCLGSPVALMVRNRDFANWNERMASAPGGPDAKPVLVPRPGHADLAGGLKYQRTDDLRDILERASARETAIRVALGAVAKALLRELGIVVGSYVRSIGAVEVPGAEKLMPGVLRTNAEMLSTLADRTTTRALTESDSNRLVAAIDEAQARRDTLGGVLEVVVTGVPIGLGSHAQFDRKLDGRLSQALLSLPAFKAVELGDGWAAARQFGSEVHDPIVLEREGKRLGRSSNHAGGLEAGITNGQPLVLRCAMKPIATVPAALPSVHLGTLQPTHAHVERSDTCAVPAAGVIAEAVVALELADALLEVLGGDTLASLRMPFARMRVSSRISPGHIFLVGPMGVGKSTVGAAIASRCRLPFIDLDARIEKRLGVSVAEFFAREGEPAFRDRENEELILVESEAPSVVALGGGAVLRPSNWQVMRDAGVVVHLDADPETLLERLRAENVPLERRPLLAGADPLERLRTLARERHHAYARADLHLDTRGLDAQQVADAAIGLIRSIQGPLTVRARSLGASREDGS